MHDPTLAMAGIIEEPAISVEVNKQTAISFQNGTASGAVTAQDSPIVGQLAQLHLHSGASANGDATEANPGEAAEEQAPNGIGGTNTKVSEDAVGEEDSRDTHDPEPETTPTSSGENAAAKVAKEGSPKPQNTEPPRLYALKDVSTHNTPTDMWLVVGSEVFDVSEFRNEHPGGAKILMGVAGKDATKKFDKYHRRGLLERYRSSLRVGLLDHGQTAVGTRRGFLSKLGVGKK